MKGCPFPAFDSNRSRTSLKIAFDVHSIPGNFLSQVEGEGDQSKGPDQAAPDLPRDNPSQNKRQRYIRTDDQVTPQPGGFSFQL